jgi:integrase
MSSNEESTPFERVGDIVSIFQRGRKWYANFQLNGRQHRKSLGTTSKKEARLRAIQLEAEIIQGRYRRQPPPPSLQAVVQDYQQFLRTEERAKTTRSKYNKIFERVLDLAERRLVRTIDQADIKFLDAYRGERVQAGVGPKTVFTESVVVRQLVNFALSRGLISTDPLKGVRLKKPKPTRQPCWDQTQVEKILAASTESERPKLTMLADTGMRVGEMRHLTWEDVDCVRNVIHIRPKEGWQPKTGDQRTIPMSPRIQEMLRSLPRRCRWIFPAAPSRKYPQGDHQFSDRHLLASLKRVLKKLGLPGHVHTFRHAFISQALTQGTPEAIVRQWVGHVDAEVIKLYTHIADASSQAAMQRLVDANNKPLQTERNSHDTQECGSKSARKQHTVGGHVDAESAK